MAEEVKIVVKAVRRKEPDLRKLAQALIELARLELEAEAEASKDADAQQEQAS